MKRITIGHIPGEKPRPLTMGVDSLVESKLLVQANSGGGKSNTIRLLAEQLAPHLPCIIIDPEGEFATLREKVDLVLVGEGGELAASPKNAGELAVKLLTLGVSAVIDLYPLVPAERREWVRRYCENIIAVPKKLWRPFVLFIDEAQMFAPEGSDSVACEPVIEMMTLARKRDLCAILVTPRLAALATDARAPVNNFLIGRATLDVDYKRGGEILGMPHGERRNLASLKKGQFYAFGPSFGHDGVEFTQLDKAATRPAQTGTATKAVPAPSAAIKAVVPELEKIATAENPDEVSTIEKARARIKELRQERDQARREAAKPVKASAPAPQVDTSAIAAKVQHQTRADLRKAMVPIVRSLTSSAERLARLGASVVAEQETLARSLGSFGTILEAPMPEVKLNGHAPAAARPAPPRPSPRPTNTAPATVGDLTLNKTQKRILDALAWYESLGNNAPSLTQIGAVALIDPTGGHFSNTVGPLSTSGLVVRGDGDMSLTDAGRALAEVPESAGTLDGYHDVLRQRVRKMKSAGGKTIEILNTIIDAGGKQITTEEVGQAVGIDHTGGHFSNSIGPLSTAGLITRRDGVVTPTNVLFPDGLV